MKTEYLMNGGKPYFELRCGYDGSGTVKTEVEFPEGIKKEDPEEQAAIRESLAIDACVRLCRRLNLNINQFIHRIREIDGLFREFFENPRNN